MKKIYFLPTIVQKKKTFSIESFRVVQFNWCKLQIERKTKFKHNRIKIIWLIVLRVPRQPQQLMTKNWKISAKLFGGPIFDWTCSDDGHKVCKHLLKFDAPSEFHSMFAAASFDLVDILHDIEWKSPFLFTFWLLTVRLCFVGEIKKYLYFFTFALPIWFTHRFWIQWRWAISIGAASRWAMCSNCACTSVHSENHHHGNPWPQFWWCKYSHIHIEFIPFSPLILR